MGKTKTQEAAEPGAVWNEDNILVDPVLDAEAKEAAAIVLGEAVASEPEAPKSVEPTSAAPDTAGWTNPPE